MSRIVSRATAAYAILLSLTLAAGLYWVTQENLLPQRAHTPSPPPPQTPGPLVLSDDADAKSGDFWLEQVFSVAKNSYADNLLQLYVGLDAQTQKGLRFALTQSYLSLQICDNDSAEILIQGPAPVAASLATNGSNEQTFGVLWRRGELSLWLNDKELCSTKLAPSEAAFLKLPSGARSLNSAVHLGARRAMALNDMHFADTFMRTTAGEDWKPISGKWELTALAFPERSANPFSLRAAFNNERLDEDKLNDGRKGASHYGIGIMTSPLEGTLHIERITGGSPAAHAGLAEDDIFLEIDGVNVEQNSQQAMQLLFHGSNRNEIHLKMLRPGEKQIRDFHITKEQFRWGGTPAEGIPLAPQQPPLQLNNDSVALIRCGQAGWSDYLAEVSVKALGSGGFGLAISMVSEQDCLLLRWRGQAPQSPPNDVASAPVLVPTPAPVSTDCLELVRIKEGHETVLAQKAAAYRPYEFYRMTVDWNGTDVHCRIDGNELFHVNVPDLKHGYVGLWALQGSPVFFDDVNIQSHPTSPVATATSGECGSINHIFAHEDDMEVWANPALEWNHNLESGWATHRSRFPGEQVLVLKNPRFNKLELLAFTNSTLDERHSLSATIENGKASVGGGAWTLTLLDVGPGPFQRVVLRAGAQGGELNIDGKSLPFTRGQTFELKPSAGSNVYQENGCVALRGLKNLGDPTAVRVNSSNVLEYSFNDAPADWKVESGCWGLLNKFICDPRWSWFGGRTKTVATIWNKNIFSGDITVDAHVALMMQKEEAPYERPGDYNLTLCGDGVNLDSGYTLIFGGDNNSWTRLYRKGVLVAESNKEEHRIFSDRIRHPDKPDLHQRWFHLKLEKIGDTVNFYRDNVKAFSFKDPTPIDKGQVAFWTLDNGFLLSRLRITFDGKQPAPFESRRSSRYEDARVINVYDREILNLTQPCKLPEAILKSLQTPPATFQVADADPQPIDTSITVKSTTTTEKPAELPDAYRVTNGISGGPFALQWKGLTIDPENRGIVRFAYCIEPGAKIDFYLIDTSGKDSNPNYNPRNAGAYRWRLSGPAIDAEGSDEFTPLVGTIPDVKADGRWHSVQYDLQPSWRMFWKSRGFSRGIDRVFRVMLGNLSNQGYLLAGMNGNAAGASYGISDLRIFAPRDVDKIPAKVSHVVWPFDTESDGHSISIYFDDVGGSGIKSESLYLTLCLQGQSEISVPRELLDFDPLKQRLSVDLLKINPPLALKEGEAFSLKLLGFEDRAGNASPAFDTQWTHSAAVATAAKQTPSAPLLLFNINGIPEPSVNIETLCFQGATPPKGQASPRLQESTDAPSWAPASQRLSLQSVCPQDGSQLGFDLRRGALDLLRWQYLQLEYKVPFETPFNLHMNDAQGLHSLILTDLEDARDYESGDVRSRFGPPVDFVSDGMWHRSVVPLYRLYHQANPQSSNLVSGLSFHDHGWRGTRRGMTFWIHRVVPIPVVKANEITFSCLAADLTGTPDYAICVDDQAQTDPAERVEINPGETLAASLLRRNVTLKDGWNYAHLRSRNGVGQWSEAVHRAFFLDQSGPKIVRTDPADGSSFAGRTLQLFVEDPCCVNYQSLQMSINGRIISGTTNGVRFDAASGCISLDMQILNVSWPDNSEVKVEVRLLADTLGNSLETPYVFSFKADSKTDREGPEISQLHWISAMGMSKMYRQMDMEISFALDFEEHLGHVHAMRDCKQEWLNDPAQSAGGKRAIKFTALQDDADAQIMLHKNPWHINQFPLLHFDYKVDANFKTDLLIEVLGTWYCIGFTGAGKSPVTEIGKVENVVADAQWHHACVDLKTLIDRTLPNLPIRIATKIILSSQGQDGNKRGSTLVLDNLDFSPPDGNGGQVEWSARDKSGISGYAYVFDQIATTIPTPVISQKNSSAPAGGVLGVWYAHVRACDQAGNWGATQHLRLDFGQ